MIKRVALAGIAALGLFAAPQAWAQHRPNEARDTMRALGAGLDGKALEAAIAEAERFPLGSKENPVRENGPAGQRAYLARLRCADGTAPKFARAGNVGDGPFGYIVDLYRVTCAGAPPVDVHMDMYHDGPETRPVPGFTIAGEADA